MDQPITLTQFTDPVCTWCWGSEPIIRKLQWRFGEQLKISYIMGGLVKDIREFHDRANNIGGDPEQSNKNIAEHWMEASQKHGMPVRTDGFQLFTNDHPSSYPQNIAFKAAQLQNEELANKFLRRVREATATEARQTNRRDELVGLASEVGLDITAFIRRLEDGTAREAFDEDLRYSRKHHIRAFPSYRLSYGPETFTLHGFHSYGDLKALFTNITDGAITERPVKKSEDEVLGFMKQFDSVAPIEIRKTFDLSEKEMDCILNPLLEMEKVRKVWAGNGYLLRPAQKTAGCETETGICTF